MKNFTLSFCPEIFLGVTIHVGRQENNLGQKVNENFVRIDPGKRKSKKVKKISFSWRLFEKLKQYLEGLAIFHKPLLC